MNQIKSLLREILRELRMIHAELAALREQVGSQYTITYPLWPDNTSNYPPHDYTQYIYDATTLEDTVTDEP